MLARQIRHRDAFDLLEDAIGFTYAAALGAAAQLGLADQLASGPKTPTELAATTGTRPALLHRLLRLLATREVFREDEDGRFHLTPKADLLRTDAAYSARLAVLGLTSRVAWWSADEVVASLRDGKPAFERAFGSSFFEFLASDPQLGGMFPQSMASFSASVDAVVADAGYDFPATGTVVDVGGGLGGLLLHILRRHAGLHGVLFEQPSVLRQHVLGQLGDDHRWRLAGGDFFTEVPTGGQVYLLKRVLHDWSDDGCLRILRNCRAAMADDGRVLVIEAVIPPGNQPHPGKLLDLTVMLTVPGRERTEVEFARLFRAAGLRLTRVVPTDGPVSIVEATAA